ncbi:hypothetical protein [Tomitella fengzijianii]|uniref:Uncharacterized protein n=1 Tax=Tomitella fengzijianii TaxID=2597660 RepID=A0A516X5J6_9ACTN|nr:hypothetical protein [Tomitella fengzijianii]QDQ98293.1 hypothetical protein FO059_14465 [Tomitella fengzijianii]
MANLRAIASSTVPARLRRSVVTSAVNNSSAFGYSILITATFGLLQSSEGSPPAGTIMLFAVGAVLPFSILEAIASRGFRRSSRTQNEKVILLGTATNLISVAAALGAGYGTGVLLHGNVAWLVAPFVAGLVYMLVESVELAVAEAIESAAFGEADAEGEAEQDGP